MEPDPLKVPISVVTVAAYRAVFGRLGLMLELAWLPLLVLLAVALIPAVLPANLGNETAGAPITVANLLEMIVGILCLNAFVVRWYQAALYGGGKAQVAGHPWFRPWGRFVFYSLAVYVVLGVDLVVIQLLTGGISEETPAPLTVLLSLGALLVTFGFLLIIARLSLLFPAAASSHPLGFGGAWHAMRGNTWRLVLCIFLIWAPLMLLRFLAMAAVVAAMGYGDNPPQQAPMGLYILRGLGDTVIDFVMIALLAAVLVQFYKQLVQSQQES